MDGAFFLDPQEWTVLRQALAGPLALDRGPMRALCVGCGLGQEAYSLAILLGELAPGRPMTVVATDKDPRRLARAAAGGPYTASDVRALTPEQRRRYLRHLTPQRYSVAPGLSDRIVFEPSDITNGPPPGPFHAVLFRNVQPHLQEGAVAPVFAKLRRSLIRGGALFLGARERMPPDLAVGLEQRSRYVYVSR